MGKKKTRIEYSIKHLAKRTVDSLVACEGLKKASEIFAVATEIMNDYVNKRSIIEKKDRISKKIENRSNERNTEMSEKKVTKKQLCRDLVQAGETKESIMATLSGLYLAEGKDEAYAAKRSKKIYTSVARESQKTEAPAPAEDPAPAEAPVEPDPIPEPEDDEVDGEI